MTSRDWITRSRLSPYEESLEAATRRSFFGQFPPRLLHELEADALRIDIPAGSELFHENDEPRCSLIVTGLVRVYMLKPGGDNVTVRFARPGDVIGIAAIYGGPAPVNVRMMTDASLLMFNEEKLTHMARTTPSVGWILAEEITRRYYDSLELVGGMPAGSVRQQVARILLETATEQHGQTVVSPVSRRELAHAIGTVQPVISRALRELRVKGLIGTSSHGVLLLDPEGLHLEALSVEY